MSLRALLLDALLALSVGLCLACAVGVWALPDPYQKLHFLAPPATLSAFGIALATLLGAERLQSGGKVLLLALLLSVMNAVVTHATARAARVRERGHWPPDLGAPARRAPQGGERPERAGERP